MGGCREKLIARGTRELSKEVEMFYILIEV